MVTGRGSSWLGPQRTGKASCPVWWVETTPLMAIYCIDSVWNVCVWHNLISGLTHVCQYSAEALKLSKFGEIWWEMSYSQQTNFPGEFVLQKVLSCITFEILSALGESQRYRCARFWFDSADFLEIFGEIWWDSPLAGRCEIESDHRFDGTRSKSDTILAFKKIIMEKGFRTRKWQQI